MKKVLFFILYIFLFQLSSGADKPQISVVLKISEKGYNNHFEGDIEQIIKKSKVKITEILARKYGFVEFVATDAAIQLIIDINVKERLYTSSSNLKEVGYFLSLRGVESSAETKSLYWMFKPESEYWQALPESIEPFVDEIVRKFALGLEQNSDKIIFQLLSKIPILVEDAYYINEQKFLIIPVENELFLIEKESILVVENRQSFSFMTDVIRVDTTSVIAFITDVDEANKALGVPANYPIGSLVTKLLTVGRSYNPNDFSVPPKVFLIKYYPFRKTIKIMGPDEQLSSSNTN